jgi:SAM-dependent methyltransferase
MTPSDLRRICDAVGERTGWDFSRVRADRDPVRWEYEDVVRRFLRPTDHVLDVGTCGGERFLRLAEHFATGVGVDSDPEMIRVARDNARAARNTRLRFAVMPAEALALPDASFDVVLNRHSSVVGGEIARVLRPGGVFITQQVGARNSQSIFDAFGWGSNGDWWASVWKATGERPQDVAAITADVERAGLGIVARAEYDVPYYFQDIESLVFWLKSVPLPETLDPDRHWQQVSRLLAERTTPRGIETNEHRTIVIARKSLTAAPFSVQNPATWASP